VCSVATPAVAVADNYTDYDLKSIGEKLKNTPPAPGVDKASPSAPAWCPPLSEKPYTGGFESHLGSFYQDPARNDYSLIAAAEALCKNDPKQPIIQKATAEVLQLYMNRTGLSQADAVQSMRLWKDKNLADDEQSKLCKSLSLDDETQGPTRAFMTVKLELFGCSVKDGIRQVAGTAPMERLMPWLDSTAQEPDELVRLAYIHAESEAYAKSSDDYKQKNLVNYAIDQIDYKLFQPKAALAVLDTAPFKGNLYASAVVKEAIGAARLYVARIEGDVKKLTAKDADWKSILVDAPQQGADNWTAAAAKYKTELQRSAEFEAAAYGPSKKAFAGCQEPLKKDLAAVLKPLKRDNLQQLLDEMNAHPVAGLLFRRYQACVSGAGDASAAAEMAGVKGLRVIRGPRAAAYFATVDAIGKVRADRSKFPIAEQDLGFRRSDESLYQLSFELGNNSKSKVPADYHVWEEAGVVKTATKAKKGLKVVFAKDKQERYIESDCVTTGRIVTWDHDNRPIYYRKCKGSVQKVDVSPNPITVPAHLADGVAAGKLIKFGVSNSGDERLSMPFEVFSDKKGKKLIAFYGIGL